MPLMRASLQVHHVYQGCPKSGGPVGGSHGWSHAASPDLVTWTDEGIQLTALNETYEGMQSA
jgi:sucrose-6-phosphate hydrolase SacC (GH32 family)